MIPTEVENRIAKYFLHMFLPHEVMMKIEDRLLPTCIWTEDEDLDHDELVRLAIEVIEKQLKNKRLR